MNRKPLLIAIAAAAVIALGVIGYLTLGKSADSALPASGERANVTLTADDRTMGDPKAPVTVVEYAAPTCPHCAHFNETVFPKLKVKYIDTGKVFYVFRVFPLSSVDLAVEALARCLPTESYFNFIDLLFKNQVTWDPEFQPLDVHEGILTVARMAGMGREQADRCMQDKTQLERASRVGQDGQTRYQITGTPSFVVNGKLHGGQYDWESLQKELDAVLKTP
ncbi:MAG TPA: DsbA family protein [Rhizomicrobium sp.]|nr:DsbA family protein [Rhizomicrobium sp.]